ncbi:MAG TPA: cytochrome c, partial [Marmoricola sp.]|nr:cytochrome c [Marmoricola sp.]
MRFINSLAGRLSQRRRSRLATPALLLAALLMCAGGFAIIAPTNAAKTSDDADAIAKGRALFLVGCSSCHGKNGEGVLTKNGGQYGPSLVGVGAAAVDFQVGSGRMPMANPGVQAPRKKVIYTEDEISQLAAYVASLGPGPAIPAEGDYSVAGATNEQIRRGGEIFRTNCTACHNFAGSGGALPGGKYAPKLTGVSEK